MNLLDFVVLVGSMLGIGLYGVWRTRGRRDLHSYLKGDHKTPWLAIGLSVMATQASAITFLSVPGQGYADGLGFVQLYFGLPIALVIVSAIFVPIFRGLNVFTAYDFLGRRFDGKTRLLGAGLFLLQRGLGAGLTIYAPAIVLTSVFGWSLNLTIISSGLLVTLYTVMGGSAAVTVTQNLQFGVIFGGMLAAFWLLVAKLPAALTVTDTLALAGGFHKLAAVNFSADVHQRYTLWSGLLGGTFLMLSYFGTDQSQVQRYISGGSTRESRLGLMFNAVCKIPMQFCILMLGVLIFVFYRFEEAPLFFNPAYSQYLSAHPGDARLREYDKDYAAAQAQARQHLQAWMEARHRGDGPAAREAFSDAQADDQKSDAIHAEAQKAFAAANSSPTANDADYVFITFILKGLPHGVIGLLVAAFFAAALSSKAAELNALGSSTTVDFYRHLFHREMSDANLVIATKWFTALWGLVAIGFALYAHLVENLIQAVNILGSIFYGVMLGLFLVAFFLRGIGGTAVFWSALTAQALVFVLYFNLTISYLWYPLIGCATCVVFSGVAQALIGRGGSVGQRSVA
jgi:SSS family solute:Na+ symporter